MPCHNLSPRPSVNHIFCHVPQEPTLEIPGARAEILGWGVTEDGVGAHTLQHLNVSLMTNYDVWRLAGVILCPGFYLAWRAARGGGGDVRWILSVVNGK